MVYRNLLEKDLFVRGKHAEIHEKLLKTALFANNHEIVELAMMTGIIYGETDKVSQDSDKAYKVGKETMRDSGQTIVKLYRLCMLIHDDFIEEKERLKRAFGYDNNGDEAEPYVEILLSYMRGGYNVLNNKIINYGPHPFEKKKIEDFI